MAQFPIKEAEIMALAQSVASGLGANSSVFPAPPVEPARIRTAIESFLAARDAAVAAQAATAHALATKSEALQALADDLKADLRYGENIVNYDDEKLKLLGWGGRRSKTSLEAPGQCRTLEVIREGEGWVFLDWKEPAEGGKPAAYKVQRRLRPEGMWQDAGLAVESEVTLSGQERGKEWEYRVIAVNKAGEGMPSNSVTAVL